MTETFAVSDGADEAVLIERVARRLLTATPARDVHAFGAMDGADLVAAIVFSRLRFAGDTASAFVLGPVAVASGRQREGIGQRLIQHGLNAIRDAGVELALTYGDPHYYVKTGFQPVSEADIPAPYPLRFPEGWQGQSLTGAEVGPRHGPCICVPAFADPVYW